MSSRTSEALIRDLTVKNTGLVSQTIGPGSAPRRGLAGMTSRYQLPAAAISAVFALIAQDKQARVEAVIIPKV